MQSAASSAAELPGGEYLVRADASGFLLAQQRVQVAAGSTAQVSIELSVRPARPRVRVTDSQLSVRGRVRFKGRTAELNPDTVGLLAEVADALLRDRTLRRVEVQVHTDDQGTRSGNLLLSQQRADSVVAWLTHAGVESHVLQARGYGSTRPLLPNLTPENRARNRRVQFAILERAADQFTSPEVPSP